ncbi:MAG TPA: site-2 protease family protein [Thermoanaerobaculia bacterium]|nr:site-2 protease family protein [Thermoanaerobaculia bacterium]
MSAEPSPLVPPPLPRRKERWWLHALLLVLTIATTTWAGAFFVAGFDPEGSRKLLEGSPSGAAFFLEGAKLFSLPLLAILLSHEMGHYLVCRSRGIDASPPYFIPFPPLVFNITGTFGAFIRIREPFRNRRDLFDVGVAGPIAGFVVALPVLVYGLLHTRTHAVLANAPPGTIYFGYPLGLTLLQKLFLGRTFTTIEVSEHPMLLAGWFGLLVTAINLMPLSQLDGGHALYAVLGRWQKKAVPFLLLGLAILGAISPAWWLWFVIVLVIGTRHPPTLDDDTPLDARRIAVAVATLAIFVLSIAPKPIWQN